ncbi:hypothetical protein T05_3994 [Trichinella murrelli]|uniref:Uncharacterized protein n=1 Tax=Trichinella murrelli TaxID=144512 RepID=A0A0V0TR45_9BILA|nr:hypothetical protein T05_3994 [Trichinella murrelli]
MQVNKSETKLRLLAEKDLQVANTNASLCKKIKTEILKVCMAEQESRGNERHVLVLTNQSKPHISDKLKSVENGKILLQDKGFNFTQSEDVTDVDGDKSERCLLKETSATSVESRVIGHTGKTKKQHLPSLYFYLDDEFSLLDILTYSLSGCHKRQHLRSVSVTRINYSVKSIRIRVSYNVKDQARFSRNTPRDLFIIASAGASLWILVKRLSSLSALLRGHGRGSAVSVASRREKRTIKLSSLLRWVDVSLDTSSDVIHRAFHRLRTHIRTEA